MPLQGDKFKSITKPRASALGYELLPFQGVLLVSITTLGYELLPFTFALPFGQRFPIPFGR